MYRDNADLRSRLPQAAYGRVLPPLFHLNVAGVIFELFSKNVDFSLVLEYNIY